MRALQTVATIVLSGALAAAADHPVPARQLQLRDPANVAARRLVFKTPSGATASPLAGADPRVVGATLRVAGPTPGDGDSGVVPLDAAGWVGLGSPAGSRGYRFVDRTRAHGIKTVVFKAGRDGTGTLAITGGGAAWPYAVPQPQGPVEVQLRIGDDVHCARFATFAVDVAGTVRARQAPAPAACDAAPGCGNGVLTAAETCDDGNRADGDGCSSTCTLEDARGLCAGVPTSASTALRAVPVVTGLDRPVFVTAAPLDPDRLFVVEQDGLVRIVDHGVLRATPFLDLSHDIAFGTYDGMLGMAFHPDYASNGLFFVNFTNPDGATEVRHYQVSADPDVADAASGTTVIVLPIDVPPPAHNGGLVAFGPDGDLYVSMGDGSLGGDPFHRGQDDGVLLAKLLRLDVGTTPYAIPPTNPFAGDPTKRGEIWASGLRNPFRFSFDRATGDLYIGDVGQDAFEEIDVQPATSTGGENYGWSIFEADACYTPPCPPPAGFTFPVLAYPHTDGCDVTGGYVYRGCRLPALRGTYFYSDFCSAFVRTFRWSGGVATDAQDRTAEFPDVANVVSFGEDARGELYLVGYGNGADGAGAVYRIEPAE